MKIVLYTALLFVIALFAGCESKYQISSLPSAGASGTIGDTLYVHLNPDWTGFNQPTAIAFGNDGFLYVADTYNDRIVMLDRNGVVIGYASDAGPNGMRRPISIAQDYRLNLLVCAQFDTTLPGHTSPTTFGAVYRLNLFAVGNNISQGVLKKVFFEPSDSARRYTAVATLYNNSYYVSRTGPNNTGIDKDDNILLFFNDILLTGLPPYFTWGGTGFMSIGKITGLATMPTKRSVDYVFCQTGATSLFKVQWIQLIVLGQTTDYESKFSANTSDLSLVNRFQSPEGVTFDPAGNLYVVDAQTDSLYRFSPNGAEHYSFGGTGSGDRQFRQPSGVAFSPIDHTLYVADAGNNRIVRFKLSTEINY